MTREEATHVFHAALMYRLRPGVDAHSYNWCESIVHALEKLGLLELESPEDSIVQEAVARLTGALINTQSRFGECGEAKRIHSSGAAEIVDILLKSGFKITKESK